MISVNRFLLFLIFYFVSCSGKKEDQIVIDQNKAKLYFNERKKVLLFSCMSCSCFIPALESAYQEDSIFLKAIYLATDTSCNSLSFKLKHVPQKAIDEVSDNLYNIILLRLKNGKYDTKIIDSRESPKIIKIAKNFFE